LPHRLRSPILNLPDVFTSQETAIMGRGTTAGLFVALLLTTAAADEGPRWLTDYARAREVARAAGKPIFLVFRCER
jgi:hypothetical protein